MDKNIILESDAKNIDKVYSEMLYSLLLIIIIFINYIPFYIQYFPYFQYKNVSIKKSVLKGSGLSMQKNIFKKVAILYLIISMMLILVGFTHAIDADEIIKKFTKVYKNMKNFTADFEYTTLVAGKKRVSFGKITFQKPNLLRQEYFEDKDSNKVTQLIVSNGKELISYTPMIKQVTKQDISENEIFLVLGQSFERIDKDYNVKLLKDELAEKKNIHLIELIPKKKDNSAMFDTIQVWVKDEDSIPTQVMYKDNKNEATFFFSFENVKINNKLDKSVFEFQIPNGVQVITVPNK
ncbi:TPA: outer membrane lipoprotein carrier protein LolA [bacterium]|nr:outer membrane lipoprotein carrier protein LolA [bacterium]